MAFFIYYCIGYSLYLNNEKKVKPSTLMLPDLQFHRSMLAVVLMFNPNYQPIMSMNVSSEEMKPIFVSQSSKLNEDIVRNLEDVFRFASPREYRDALMEIYQQYIIKEYESLPVDFRQIAERMTALMTFLKNCED